MIVSTRTLWKHKDLDDDVSRIQADEKKRIQWIFLQLAISGKTPATKPIYHHEQRWLRDPLKHKFQFYLWWIPIEARGTEKVRSKFDDNVILLRSVRHHERNKESLNIGEYEDYIKVDINLIDPRYDDQENIIENICNDKDFKCKLVNGIPGSGKTIALLYSALDLVKVTDYDVLYLTYTNKLADIARNFFEVHKVSDQIIVRTFNELCSEILKIDSSNIIQHTYTKEIYDFENYISKKSHKELGEWLYYPNLLWMELRAYLFGMALPLPWTRQGIGLIPESKVLDYKIYRKIRIDMLDEKELKTAHNIALQILASPEKLKKFFPDYNLARSTISKLTLKNKEDNSWSRKFAAVIVDEIQDFTLLQICMLLQLSRNSIIEENNFSFLLAGDESQTVYPSAFDWSKTKDLIFDVIPNCKPVEINLIHQRRSPTRLAKLIDDSIDLYRLINNKFLIPKCSKSKPVDDEEKNNDEGKLFRLKLGEQNEWETILLTIKEYPSIAIVDLDYESNKSKWFNNEKTKDSAIQNVYSTEIIKGLEKKVVIITGIEEKFKIIAESDNNKSKPSKLEKRYLIDNIRVAISRSVDTLILIEISTDIITQYLNLEDINSSNWTEIREHLHSIYDKIGVSDKVFEFIINADESYLNQDFERGIEQIEQAEKLYNSNHLDAEDLLRDIYDQKNKILFSIAEYNLEQARGLIKENNYDLAEKRNQTAHQIMNKLQIEVTHIKAIYSENLEMIKTWHNFVAFKRYMTAGDIIQATRYFRTTIINVEKDFISDNLNKDIKLSHQELLVKLKSSIKSFWKSAEDFKHHRKWSEAAKLFQVCADYYFLKGKEEEGRSMALDFIAKRYKSLPPTSKPTKEFIEDLVKSISNYSESLALYKDKNELRSQPKEYLKEWLFELLLICRNKPQYLKLFNGLPDDPDLINTSIRESSEIRALAFSLIDSIRLKGMLYEARKLYERIGESLPDELTMVFDVIENRDKLKIKEREFLIKELKGNKN